MRLNLKRCRTVKGLTSKDMARLFGISASYYYKIESGTRNARYDLALKIAEYFACETLEDLKKLFFMFENYQQYERFKKKENLSFL